MEDWGLYLIAAAFALNGFGMLIAGLRMPVSLQREGDDFGHSWLLSKLGPQTEAILATIIWGLAGIGFIVAGVGLALGQGWWVYGAWLGAPLTITAVALWFGAVPSGTYAGGVLAALTIGALVWLQTR